MENIGLANDHGARCFGLTASQPKCMHVSTVQLTLVSLAHLSSLELLA